MDLVSQYSGDQSAVVISDLPELSLTTEDIGVGVDEGNKIERIGQSTVDTFENANEEKPASRKLDELAIVPYKPDASESESKTEDAESMSKTAKGVIVAVSASAATAVYSGGVGVTIVEAGVGLYTYMSAVPTTAGILGQYFGFLGASGVGTAAGGVIQGAGLAIGVNVIPAVIVGGGLMFGGAYIYNKLMAKTPEEKVSVELMDLAKPTYAQITGTDAK